MPVLIVCAGVVVTILVVGVLDAVLSGGHARRRGAQRNELLKNEDQP